LLDSIASQSSASGQRRLFVPVLALAALASCARAPDRPDGPPARIVGGPGDTLVVNEYLAARLPVNVVDREGHTLSTTGLRFRWESGDAVPVSALGIVRCERAGDATVRASLGALTQRFQLLCRPVHKLLTSWMVDLVAGDSEQELSVDARDLDGKPVAPLVGKVVVDDSTVAMIHGLSVRPLAPGETAVHVRIGNYSAGAFLTVAERVRSLEELHPGQSDVVVPVRLAGGEERKWRLRPGAYMLWFRDDPGLHVIPDIRFEGARCEAIFGGTRFLCRSSTPFAVIVSHRDTESSGELALRRLGTALRPRRR
jgi:hypothetical protein